MNPAMRTASTKVTGCKAAATWAAANPAFLAALNDGVAHSRWTPDLLCSHMRIDEDILEADFTRIDRPLSSRLAEMGDDAALTVVISLDHFLTDALLHGLTRYAGDFSTITRWDTGFTGIRAQMSKQQVVSITRVPYVTQIALDNYAGGYELVAAGRVTGQEDGYWLLRVCQPDDCRQQVYGERTYAVKVENPHAASLGIGRIASVAGKNGGVKDGRMIIVVTDDQGVRPRDIIEGG